MTTNGTTPHMHTITALVQDQPGVLNRISSMFRRRGFNIASLAVGHSETPGLSRMTFVVDSSQNEVVEQVTKQLRKVIEVVKVSDLSEENIVARELALIKVKVPTAHIRSEIIQIVEPARESRQAVTISEDESTSSICYRLDRRLQVH